MDNLTRAEKAIKIAKYEGYVINQNLYIAEYSSFNGLMPIVERVNKAFVQRHKEVSELRKAYLNENKETLNEGVHPGIFNTDEFTNRLSCFNITTKTITTFFWDGHETILYDDLIDALQDAIIYYYENKDK